MHTDADYLRAIKAAEADGNDEASVELRDMFRKHLAQRSAPIADAGIAGGASALAKGALFGLADEGMGIGYGAYQKASGDPRPFATLYAEGRDAQRGLDRQFESENPKTALALNVVGGIAGPGKFIAGGNTYGQLARRGALAGALSGFGAGEGDPGAQALSTGAGAAIGGVAAPALAYGASQAGRGIGALSQRLREMPDDFGVLFGGAGAESSAPARITQQPGPRLIDEAVDTYENLLGSATPGRIGPEYARLVKRAGELGMKLTPGERGNSLALRQAEAGIRSSPWVGQPLNDVRDANRAVLNRLSSQQIGANSDELSPVVIGQRATAIGDELDSIATGIKQVRVDDEARTQLNRVMTEATDPVAPNRELARAVKRLQEAQDVNAGISGERLMGIRSTFGTKARDAWSQGKAELAQGYEALQDVLDGIVERQAGNPALASRWANARAQWRALKVLERPGVVTKGNVNPASLNTALRSSYKGDYARAGDVRRGVPNDWFDAARISTWMGDVVGDSGTATRSAWAGLGRNPNVLDVGMSVASRAVASPLTAAYMRTSPGAGNVLSAAPSTAGAQASGGVLAGAQKRKRRK